MTSWQNAPFIFVDAICCPACGDTRPIVVRSDRGDDGSRSRRCICRECSRRYIAVIEIPGFGKPEIQDGKVNV